MTLLQLGLMKMVSHFTECVNIAGMCYYITFIAPSAPLDITAMASSSTAIDVTWTEPSMPNGVIRHYQVTYTRNDVMDAATQTINETSTAVQLTDLEKFANYTIFVQGFTVELGEQSDSVTARTDEDGMFL